MALVAASDRPGRLSAMYMGIDISVLGCQIYDDTSKEYPGLVERGWGKGSDETSDVKVEMTSGNEQVFPSVSQGELPLYGADQPLRLIEDVVEWGVWPQLQLMGDWPLP